MARRPERRCVSESPSGIQHAASRRGEDSHLQQIAYAAAPITAHVTYAQVACAALNLRLAAYGNLVAVALNSKCVSTSRVYHL